MVLGSIKKRISSLKSKISKKKESLSKKIPKGLPPKKVEMKLIDDIFKDFTGGKKTKNERFAFLGIGNDLKGDDGIGWYVIDELRKKFKKDGNTLLVKTSVPENHVREITDFAPNMLIIIDAADFSKSPGSIKSIKSGRIRESFISTHTTPVTLFLRLYQHGESVKKPVVIVGIQRQTNEFGKPISPSVKNAGDNLVSVITDLYARGILDLSLEKEIRNLSDSVKKLTKKLKKIKK